MGDSTRTSSFVDEQIRLCDENDKKKEAEIPTFAELWAEIEARRPPKPARAVVGSVKVAVDCIHSAVKMIRADPSLGEVTVVSNWPGGDYEVDVSTIRRYIVGKGYNVLVSAQPSCLTVVFDFRSGPA